ncbi:MAG: toll/interleukin-1 receptor domain-containing protein, partial [Candidatus Contendobacter sp.]|nr:toll/interleukin-1 receptor domain-containing protein [Candidatus Contendobacter sp.]
MDQHKIFVSYSHRDPKALQELERFLKPLGREGLISNWTDNQIKPGEDWRAEIDQALATATVAVLLVSQDFLNSDFILGTELPRILARADAGEMTVLPIFLRPFDTALEIPFPDRRGVKRTGKITPIQGFSTPDKPLLELSPTKRDRVYKQLAQHLRELAKETPVPPPRPGVPEIPPNPPFSKGGTERIFRSNTLTIHLAQRNQALDIRYYLPGMEAIASATHAWQDVLAARGDPQGALFELLFGAETEWEPVFRHLFQQPAPQPRPNPILHPVRLRICTEEPLLLALPWSLITWNHYRLSERGWTFTTTGVLDPTEDCKTSTPCPALIVAPASGTPDPYHPQAIGEALRQICPTGRHADYVRQVGTRAELERALCGMRPHLVDVCASGSRQEKQPGLLLDDGWLSLSELAGWFKQYPPHPAVVFLNVTGLTDSGLTPGQVFGNSVPLVIWRRTSEWEADAASTVTKWLH